MKQQEAMEKKMRGRLLTEFDHVIASAKEVAGSGKATVVPSGLLSACAARNRRFAGRRQQDSHELMRVLVEGMRDQNEKMLRKERENRLYYNLSKWTLDDICEWFEFYDIDFHNTARHKSQGLTAEDDYELDITPQDFCQFIKSPNKYGIPEFFSKIGLNQNLDKQLTLQFSRGRVYLANEECDFYCDKYGIERVPAESKHLTKKKKSKGKSEQSSIVDTKIRTIIDDVFGGQIQSCVTCYGCGNTSKTTEEFFDLSLPISVPKTVKSYSFGGGRRGRNSRGNSWQTKKKKRKGKKKNTDESSETSVSTNSTETDVAEMKEDELPAIRGLDRLKGTVNVNDCL